MKITLAVLAALLVVSVVLNLRQAWRAAELHDRRPAEALFRSRYDLLLSTRGTDAREGLSLPAGVILQESTPRGAATLGKRYAREFLLIIRTEDPGAGALEEARLPTPEHFEAPYTFEADTGHRDP